MNLDARLRKLERRTVGAPPDAVTVFVDGVYTVILNATGERLSPEEYARRYPGHSMAGLKCYLDWAMIDLFWPAQPGEAGER